MRLILVICILTGYSFTDNTITYEKVFQKIQQIHEVIETSQSNKEDIKT